MGLPFGRSKTTSCPKLQDRWKEGRHLLGAVGFQGLNRVPSHVFFFCIWWHFRTFWQFFVSFWALAVLGSTKTGQVRGP